MQFSWRPSVLGSLSGGYAVSKHTKETNRNSKRLAGSNFNKRLSDLELFTPPTKKCVVLYHGKFVVCVFILSRKNSF